jgi:nucleotide-binding universal stress UspA family protein
MREWLKICCAVDFSEPSRAALEEAAALAQRTRAELLVVHVTHAEPGSGALFAPPARGESTRASQAAKLDAWTRDAQGIAPGLVTSLELGGSPAATITGCVDEFGCDLVVVGSRARPGPRHLGVGSVAAEVIRTSRRPVLVVPSHAR